MDESSLKSMKRTPEDKRNDMGATAPIEAMAPDYPWGLCLNLDKDELDKVGMTKMPDVGTEVMILAKAKVTRVTASAVEGQKDENCVSLQITDMAVQQSGE